MLEMWLLKWQKQDQISIFNIFAKITEREIKKYNLRLLPPSNQLNALK
jgi:hypothetical protein